MTRRFIAGVLSVSIAIAGFSAAPARAGDTDDIAKFLGAAATIFIIGKAIEQSRDRKDKKKKKKKRAHQHTHSYDDYERVPRVIPRKNKKHYVAPIPQRCVRKVEGAKTRKVAMSRCLERRYHSAKPLPSKCRMRVETQRGYRSAYSMRCLKKRGYTIARN